MARTVVSIVSPMSILSPMSLVALVTLMTLMALMACLPPCIFTDGCPVHIVAPTPARVAQLRTGKVARPQAVGGEVGGAVSVAGGTSGGRLWLWWRRSSDESLLSCAVHPLLGGWCGEGATAATEEKVDGSKDWVVDNGTNNGHQAGAAILLGLENSRGELHGDRHKGWKDSATVGAKDAEDDIVPSDAELQAG